MIVVPFKPTLRFYTCVCVINRLISVTFPLAVAVNSRRRRRRSTESNQKVWPLSSFRLFLLVDIKLNFGELITEHNGMDGSEISAYTFAYWFWGSTVNFISSFAHFLFVCMRWTRCFYFCAL